MQRPHAVHAGIVHLIRDVPILVVVIFFHRGLAAARAVVHVLVVDQVHSIAQRSAGPPAHAAAQYPQGVAVHHKGVVGVHGVFQHQHPVAVEHAEGWAADVVLLEHLRRNVLLRSNGLALAHPDEDHAFESHRGELPCFHAGRAHHHGIGAFGEESHAVAIAVERRAVVGTREETFEVAAAHGQVHRPMGTPVQKGLDLTLLVLEKHHVGAQHPQHGGLVLLDVLGRQGRVPVLAEPQGRNATAAVPGIVRNLERRGGVEPLRTRRIFL